MKRKTLTLTLCLLATLALASIGFASWIIANPEIEGGETTGQFTVYDATPENMNATVTFEESKSAIIFGKPSDYSAQKGDWLTAGKDILVENLEVTLNISVTNANLLNGSTLDVLIYVTDVKLVNAITNGYVSFTNGTFSQYVLNKDKDDEQTVYAYKTSVTPEIDEDNNGTTSLTLQFGWGSKFGSMNPYDYYNGQSYTDSLGETAATDLNALSTALTDLKFNVKISKTVE